MSHKYTRTQLQHVVSMQTYLLQHVVSMQTEKRLIQMCTHRGWRDTGVNNQERTKHAKKLQG